MKQYIDKDALVAEIDRMLETIEQDIKDKNLIEQNVKDRDLCTIYAAQLLVLRNLAKYLDTLEVKEVQEGPYVMSDKGKFTTTTK